jgi:hypothetical protein
MTEFFKDIGEIALVALGAVLFFGVMGYTVLALITFTHGLIGSTPSPWL